MRFAGMIKFKANHLMNPKSRIKLLEGCGTEDIEKHKEVEKKNVI